MLELSCSRRPASRRWPTSRSRRTRWPTSSSPTAVSPTSSNGASARSGFARGEIQHRLLPGAFTCEGGQFTLAAWLEPAGEIAGDSFDFSIERDTLHLSMTDARGHAVGASILATLLVGALRNARRAGVELAEQARLATRASASTCSGATSSPGSSRASTCAAGPPRSSTPATSRAATARRPRRAVELLADPRSGSFAATHTGYRARRSAGRPADVPRRRDLERNASNIDIRALMIEGADVIREKACSTSCSLLKPADSGLRTTPPPCASTGTAAAGERHTDSGANL